jgi:ADP-ribosylglycohydrolase
VTSSPGFASKVRGCLLGGALGDALGYPVEFSFLEKIRADYGAAGLVDFSQLAGPAQFSDDTQLTLYTVDGLVEALEWANDGVAADETACLWLAYLRWFATQGEATPSSAPRPQPRWLDAQPVMHHRRAPGEACLSGLATGEMGTRFRPVNLGSRDCGTVMRSAPFGLVPFVSADSLYKLAVDAAALTHGHPSAHHSAAVFGNLIHRLMNDGGSLTDAAGAALERARQAEAAELTDRLETAVGLADPARGPLPAADVTAALGQGWVAEEALAIAVYAVLATAGSRSPQEHFRAAVAAAVNHDGDSDSTASIAGNILGAYYGTEALPAAWLAALEGRDVVDAMADALLKVTTAPA